MTERLEQSNFLSSLERQSAPPPPESDRDGSLRELVEIYANTEVLRLLAANGEDIRRALRYEEGIPPEIEALIEGIKVILTPSPREQIKSPQDVAALLMVDMGKLMQEEMRVVCLDTKNRVQKIHTVYKGSLNTSMIRIGEIFRMPLHLNSASIVLSHNHPSTDPTPSPEDVLVTREIVQAGRLLDCTVLDHLVIGEGRFVSMRERGLGFSGHS